MYTINFKFHNNKTLIIFNYIYSISVTIVYIKEHWLTIIRGQTLNEIIKISIKTL